MISSSAGPYKIFVPHPAGKPMPSVERFTRGDTVRATGIAFQYCPQPPYNRWYELLVRDTAEITTVDRSWFLPPMVVASGFCALLLVALILWGRERRLRG